MVDIVDSATCFEVIEFFLFGIRDFEPLVRDVLDRDRPIFKVDSLDPALESPSAEDVVRSEAE